MRYHVETYTMGNSFKTYSGTQGTTDLIYGYENDIASRVNGGLYYAGNDFSISEATTPVFNNNYGGASEGIWGIYTGSLGDEKIGQVRLMNGEAYVNKLDQVWNGTFFSDVPQLPDMTIGMKNADWFNGASNGLQFPPFLNTDSDIQVFDNRLVKKVTYSHSDDSTIADSDVTVSQFDCKEFGGDVGFAFGQSFEEHAIGCGDCTVSSDTRVVTVDGSEYVYQSTLSDYFIQVQKESGYTYQTKKSSTMFIVIGGEQTSEVPERIISPFPSLDSYYGMMFPWFDLHETLLADSDKFLDKFNFIGESQTKVRRITISMSVFAAFFLILGIVSFILYKLRGSDDENQSYNQQREELVRNHDDNTPE